MKLIVAIILLAISRFSWADGTLAPKQIFELANKASVLVLTGEGAGRLRSIGTGVLISDNGLILTALHVIKGASEVQVRTSDGEIYDHVQLLGSDDRRDVAALKIPAANLPFLTSGTQDALEQGETVFTVNNGNGLGWSASEGILSAVRPASDIPGAGTGFRLIQFTAPTAPGASGGALVNDHGFLIGIITSGLPGSAFFAVPIQNVLSIANASNSISLGSGALLQLPSSALRETDGSSAAVANTSPKELLRTARTVYLYSKTQFLTVDTLDRALLQNKEWKDLNLVIVQDPKLGDVYIAIDRPLFTYVHTFVISDRKTSAVLGSGKVTAIDGTAASSEIAKQITSTFLASHKSISPAK